MRTIKDIQKIYSTGMYTSFNESQLKTLVKEANQLANFRISRFKYEYSRHPNMPLPTAYREFAQKTKYGDETINYFNKTFGSEGLANNKTDLKHQFHEVGQFLMTKTSTFSSWSKNIRELSKSIYMSSGRHLEFTVSQMEKLNEAMEKSSGQYNFMRKAFINKNISEGANKLYEQFMSSQNLYDKFWDVYDKITNGEKRSSQAVLQVGSSTRLQEMVYKAVTDNDDDPESIAVKLKSIAEDFYKENNLIEAVDDNVGFAGKFARSRGVKISSTK